MKESDLELKCRELVENINGHLLKWTSPGRRGVQDRIMLIPYCPVVFVELKKPGGGKYSPAQDIWHYWMERNGFNVWREDRLDSFTQKVEQLAWLRNSTCKTCGQTRPKTSNGSSIEPRRC